MSTSLSGGATAAPRKWRRTHGLQPPLHPQQAAACIFLALFALLNFGMLLPALHSSIFLYVVSKQRMAQLDLRRKLNFSILHSFLSHSDS